MTGSTRGSSNRIGNIAPDHIYDFCTSTRGTHTFNSCGSGFDTYIRVWTQDLSRELYGCDDCGACGYQTVLTETLDAGCYKLVIDGYSYNSGSYTVQITCPSAPLDSPPHSPPSPSLDNDSYGSYGSYGSYQLYDSYGTYNGYDEPKYPSYEEFHDHGDPTHPRWWAAAMRAEDNPPPPSLGTSVYNFDPRNTGMGGIMFECVGLKDTMVTQFGFMFNGGCGSERFYEVFKLNMPGSFAGHMFTPGAWSKVASGFALSDCSAGAITAEFEVHVLAGQTQAFYIRGQLISAETNGYGVYKSDENMKLMVGNALWAGKTGFDDGYGDDYFVNPNYITVHYNLGSSGM